MTRTVVGPADDDKPQHSIAIGHYSSATGSYAIAIGNGACASGSRTIALGHGARSGADSVVAIGDLSCWWELP